MRSLAAAPRSRPDGDIRAGDCRILECIIDVLRGRALSYMFEHADQRERQLEQHRPDQATVTLHLTDDQFLRSYNWARWQPRIPLPVDR